jgi:uncharacterized protein
VVAAKFEITEDHAGKFRFHLKAPNGEIIAASQGYETKANAEKGMKRSRLMHPTPRSKTTVRRNLLDLLTIRHSARSRATPVRYIIR